jgi:predicted nucleic acid-binding protein
VNVIVDTCVWSVVLRRDRQPPTAVVEALRSLIDDHRVRMIGPIRQEVLSGIRDLSHFKRLQERLVSFPDLPIRTEDYVSAASYFNLCRAAGVQGSNTDFLICAVAAGSECAVFTTDKDFDRFARHIPLALYQVDAS